MTALHKYMAERSAALALALLSLYVFFFFVYLQTRFLQGGLDHPLLVVALVATFLVLAFRGRASYALAVLVPVVRLVAARRAPVRHEKPRVAAIAQRLLQSGGRGDRDQFVHGHG